MTEPNYISYKDSAARVVKIENKYFRYLFYEYKAEYNHLMQSGLYKALTEKKLLIEHQEIEVDSNQKNIYKKLYPAQINFLSYPFEWSYTQWRKAALSYLKINQIALKYGMILKDATPYNFYLTGGKAIMFDTSSFAFFKENDRWNAYRQFCEEFLGPIVLMQNNGSFWGRVSISTLNGLPLNFVSKQLPFKSWLNLTTLLHIHLHSKYYSNSRLDKDEKKSRGFTIEKISLLQELIYNSIYKWKKAYQYNNHWNSYYDNDIESSEYLNEKEAVIRKWLKAIKPRSVVDLGANTGRFSFIAREYAESVIALEEDHLCADIIEKRITALNSNNVIALNGSLSEPTPNLGLLNKEKESIYKRANSQMVLGLALTHHLYFTNKMSFNQIAETFNSFSSEYVIMEFIGTSDSKVEILTRNCKNRLNEYNEVNCIASMKKYFNLVESKKIEETHRTLYLFKKGLNENI